MLTIYHLQWHVSTAGPRRDEASDLFYTFYHDTPDTLEDDAFDRLYEEVAAVDIDDLEQLFAEWNRVSGRESDRFQELRYCERCGTYIDGHEEAVTHAAQNHTTRSRRSSSGTGIRISWTGIHPSLWASIRTSCRGGSTRFSGCASPGRGSGM